MAIISSTPRLKRVYVCSPVKGDQDNPHVIEENLARAVLYSQLVYKQGHLPICPQIYLENAAGLNESKNPTDRYEALKLGLELLIICDEVWVFGKRIGLESAGMKKEIEIARERMMPVHYRPEYLPKL